MDLNQDWVRWSSSEAEMSLTQRGFEPGLKGLEDGPRFGFEPGWGSTPLTQRG